MRPLFALTFSSLLFLGCLDPESQFKNGRLYEACDSMWPVCATSAGCVMGNTQYLEGTFPGRQRVVVRTTGAAGVTVALFLRTQLATGDETRIELNEPGCGSVASLAATGKEFFREADATGTYRRTQTLQRAGDHLIEVISDSTASYLMKIEIADPKPQ